MRDSCLKQVPRAERDQELRDGFPAARSMLWCACPRRRDDFVSPIDASAGTSCRPGRDAVPPSAAGTSQANCYPAIPPGDQALAAGESLAFEWLTFDSAGRWLGAVGPPAKSVLPHRRKNPLPLVARLLPAKSRFCGSVARGGRTASQIGAPAPAQNPLPLVARKLLPAKSRFCGSVARGGRTAARRLLFR